MLSRIHIRSYGDPAPLHTHDHVQVVLPFDAGLEIEVEGQGSRLSSQNAAFIPVGARHTQAGVSPNRSLVLDAPEQAFGDEALARLGVPRFFQPSAELGHLIAFAASRAGSGEIGVGDDLALARLLVGALRGPCQGRSALSDLAQAILRAPGRCWSTSRLARHLGVSRSGLFRLIAAEAGTTPAQFVTQLRLEAAGAAIRDTVEPLAEIALWAGFSDQSALTRAMRRETGLTPGALRRRGMLGP
jgi:AraC-like DNA-binding protein